MRSRRRVVGGKENTPDARKSIDKAGAVTCSKDFNSLDCEKCEWVGVTLMHHLEYIVHTKVYPLAPLPLAAIFLEVDVVHWQYVGKEGVV
jgi:hypothetical protein